jgi:uncharacterized protein
MRRDEKEIKDRREIDSIIRRSQVCRLGLSDNGQPYIVPLCFGYDGKALYFHCAKEGRKLDILRRNNKVCVEFDIVEELVEADQGCKWSMRYQSVIGSGTAHVIEDMEQVKIALTLLMAQYSKQSFVFSPEKLKLTVVIKIEIKNLTGKQSKRLT